jgi:hypothetical protein
MTSRKDPQLISLKLISEKIESNVLIEIKDMVIEETSRIINKDAIFAPFMFHPTERLGDGFYLTVVMNNSPDTNVEFLASIIFEIHLRFGVKFQKYGAASLFDSSMEISLDHAFKPIMIDFDYDNHTYHIYDVTAMIKKFELLKV